MIGGKVLDHTALLDLAESKTVYGAALLDVATAQGIVLVIPQQCLVAVAMVVSPTGQVRMDDLLSSPVVLVDGGHQLSDARLMGRLLGRLGVEATAEWLAFAHAVVVARRRGWPVVTRESNALLLLDPEVTVEPIP